MKIFKILSQVYTSVLWGAIVIPLNVSSPQWHSMTFAKIKPNKVSFTEEGLLVEVEQSASPLFYRLTTPIKVRGFTAEGILTGLPEINRLKEGMEGNDDFSLRLGFVETAANPPSWFDKIFMPDWITDLLELFPKQGIKKVRFFTMSQIKNPGTFRIHPKNDLMEETVILKKEQPGKFSLDYPLSESIPASAIWIQTDGDDSKSTFTLKLSRLVLNTEEPVH
jgi:hypothetical protein